MNIIEPRKQYPLKMPQAFYEKLKATLKQVTLKTVYPITGMSTNRTSLCENCGNAKRQQR